MKKALIIINISKDTSMCLAKQIGDFLKAKKIHVDFLSFDGFSDNPKFSCYDFVITLGGDGTVLFAARNSVEADIPVFPVNLGEFGFIASIQPEEWKTELENYLDGRCEIEERLMIKVCVQRDGKTVYSSFGLNDVVISAKGAATTVSLAVKYNNNPLCRLKADGAIVSTPTGSTAYSASAGGPIVGPNIDVLVLTPLNAFSLSSRPIILNPDGKLDISVEKCRTKELIVTVDGQEPFLMQLGDTVSVSKYEKSIKLISCTTEKFYNALRSKLNWSGVPHA